MPSTALKQTPLVKSDRSSESVGFTSHHHGFGQHMVAELSRGPAGKMEIWGLKSPRGSSEILQNGADAPILLARLQVEFHKDIGHVLSYCST